MQRSNQRSRLDDVGLAVVLVVIVLTAAFVIGFLLGPFLSQIQISIFLPLP